MKIITVEAGIAKGKTSMMYRIASNELQDAANTSGVKLNVLVIAEDRIPAHSSKDFILFHLHKTSKLSTIYSIDFHNLTVCHNVSKYFELDNPSNVYDMVLVDGLYDRKYLDDIKPLLRSEDSLVIMTQHAPMVPDVRNI